MSRVRQPFTMKKRGRPKGHSRDSRSFGPLGDLIRKFRLEQKYGLADVAKACGCSVQFISNIEHGRAPLPWDKVEVMAKFLKIATEELHAANLCMRSDFKSFVKGSTATRGASSRASNAAAAAAAPKTMVNAAAVLTLTARDSQLREIIKRYQSATPASRASLYKLALKTLSNNTTGASASATGGSSSSMSGGASGATSVSASNESRA